MVAVAVLSADPVLRRSLEQLRHDKPAITKVDFVDHSSDLLRLVSQTQVDVVLMDIPTHEQLEEWRDTHRHIALLVLLDTLELEDAVSALNAGARAVLHRSSNRRKIITAILAAADGLAILEPEFTAALVDEAPPSDGSTEHNSFQRARLTPRELEVLAAMADGASNKAIARRLGISFHTAKFHVAAILTKLDAETRTEAVMKAAQSGLVML
jgi:DNA-binding NarL/FixJ family response regulator